MSFTNDVKKELCGNDISGSFKDIFIYGLLYGFRNSEPALITESEYVAECFKNLLPKKSVDIGKIVLKNRKTYSIEIKDAELLDKYCFGSDKINTEFVNGSDIVTGVFLRGVFLSCGNVSVQKAGYHLELSINNPEKCEKLYNMINEQGMIINRSKRGCSHFLYSKNSENISDFLTFIGAMQSSMEIMNIKIFKEVRSNINRVVNCEAANIEKTASAAAKQILDIKLIDEKIGLSSLDEDLSEIAKVRLENPDVSLSGLVKLLDKPISRSGVNHRFLRIAKIAEELREKE